MHAQLLGCCNIKDDQVVAIEVEGYRQPIYLKINKRVVDVNNAYCLCNENILHKIFDLNEDVFDAMISVLCYNEIEHNQLTEK